ncbi:unnamed protein product [Parnassius apollo]|uniref:(apollo) hypothetical protein n=1 Tax=Parnassius apollo TaxID=110799 RepID=A0A8S3Y9J2_PARAO|nr:unnamed protein product [Parnassius apollo]
MITNSGNADECSESGNAEHPKRNTPARKRKLRQLDNIVTKARLVADVIGNSGTSSNHSETSLMFLAKV